MSITDAMKGVGVPFPPARPVNARRIQIATAQGPVSPVLKMLFTLSAGKSSLGALPEGGGFFVVKVGKITPGNAVAAPDLITQVQGELRPGDIAGLCRGIRRRDQAPAEDQAQ